MTEYIKRNVQVQVLAAFVIMPITIWTVGSFPARSVLKDTLSLTTILAFSLTIALFYLARPNRYVASRIKMSSLVRTHKALGYTVLCVLLVHPFLLVVPRFYEAGISPLEAFQTILGTLSSQGVVLGLVAWGLMLILVATALLRRQLPLGYQMWRFLHGLLAGVATICAVLHVIDLGRHSSTLMSAFIVLLSLGGVAMLVRNYRDEKSVSKPK